MKILYFLLFLSLNFLYASQLQIVADRFEANQKKGLSTFTGHVVITKDKDVLKANTVKVFTDEKNHPTKYEALKSVRFKVTSDENSTYEGKSERLVYLPEANEYQFYSNVKIKELKTLRTLSGDKIIINITTGNAEVVGKAKEPIRITFEIKDDNNGSKTAINNSKK